MAFIYDKATLTPGKIDLLNAWLPSQPRFTGDVPATKLDAYRFDDPDDEVGMEAFLLQAGDAVYHVPVTYRGAPLDGAGGYLVGTSEHSELGTRWVDDGAGDSFRLRVVRRIGSPVTGEQTLSGRWKGGAGVLAGVSIG